MLRLRALLPLLLVLPPTLPAEAGTRFRALEAAPVAGPVLGLDAAWREHAEAGLPLAAQAAGHALAPVVRTEPTTRLEVSLPGGRALRVSALALRSATTGRSLPVGAALAVRDALVPEQLRIEGSWHGADELFVLEASSLKHVLELHETAWLALGGGELHAEWLVEAGADTRLASEGAAGLVLRDSDGGFLARIPPPLVADGDDAHWHPGAARWELSGAAPAWRLRMVVAREWAEDPVRVFPLRLDPTISLQPADDSRTGFVDENGQGLNGSIDSGSLEIIFAGGGPTGFFGRDCRGYAEFDTSSIPDSARVLSVRLQVWFSNHGNPGREIIEDPVQPLEVQVKQTLAQPTAATPDALWAAIGGLDEGPVYVSEVIPETGPEWCPDSYVFRDWDLGPQAASDLEAQLPSDYFTTGFTSFVGLDVGFDHVDWVGYPETGLGGFGCPTRELPGSRITLVVETNSPPVCAIAEIPVSDCPSEPVLLDGSASFDPDGDALRYSWTTDCAGTIRDADQALASLLLDGACEHSCSATLTVTEDRPRPESATCSAPVEAADRTPPVVLATSFDGLCLWPPRHDGFPLGEAAGYVVAEDACSAVTVQWLGCFSDQPDEAREAGRPENGDGHFPNDCEIVGEGEDLRIRVERAGNDPEGRHYGLTALVSDGCGNSVVVEGRAHVPHDRRGGSGGQDDPCLRGDKRK